jgi:hypothetical protein
MFDLKAKFQSYVKAQLSRVLTQMDRDPDSPTFGCFDRNYWHYKICDFPSSILQQGVFTLEAIRNGNVEFSAPTEVLERWCLGAINALAKQVNNRGSVNEYYPFENSYPAAAFGLHAVCRILFDWRYSAPKLLESVNWAPLRRLANHVAGRIEKHAINQQAIGLAGLSLAAKLDFVFPQAETIDKHATRLFNSQHSTGWFEEYGGPDFGYLTVTLDAIADYYDATGDPRALESIERAVNFLAKLVGADGRLPSTLNSRNSDYVVPYGLVRASSRNPLAAWLVETLFHDIDQSTHPIWATDDRYHSHYIFSSIVRSLPYLNDMKSGQAPSLGNSIWMDDCGFWIYWPRDREWTAYVAARKGGLVRIHRAGGLPPIAEYGWRIRSGSKLWTSNWWSADWVVEKEDDFIRIRGLCRKVQFHIPNPYKHIVLRLVAFILREKITPLLKRIMIFRPEQADGPLFERVVEISEEGVSIKDRIDAFKGAEAMPSPRQNLRHVASADSFSAEELLPPLLGIGTQTLDRELFVNTKWEVKIEQSKLKSSN